MSVLQIVLIAVAVLAVVFFAGGLVVARRRRHAPDFEAHLLAADRALEEAKAKDRGWDRAALEAAARGALAESRPGFEPDDLHLVLVDDRPGVHEDRAEFLAVGAGGEARISLVRSEAGWAADRVEQSLRAEELIPGFGPETELERALAGAPEVLEGLAWGRPRSGHPEGPVGTHVADLLRTIDEWGMQGTLRAELRLIALVHDSLKNRVNRLRPRGGENHHAMRARRVAERFIDDERLLATIELHDRPYALWRKMRRRRAVDHRGFERMMRRVPDAELFLAFIELDGSTEGKRSEPIRWLREELRLRGYLPRG